MKKTTRANEIVGIVFFIKKGTCIIAVAGIRIEDIWA